MGIALAADTPATPDAYISFQDAVTDGKAQLDLRYRFEAVDQKPFTNDAAASTLRSRLNYETGEWQGLSAFFEVDNITVIGNEDNYNSTTNGVTDRPTVADPESTEVNQAYLQYRAGSIAGLLGRQRILLDDQRFIANVGWRQNEQTYDALTFKTGALPRTQLQYSYLENVNRVTGPDDGAQPANYRSNSHVLNSKVELGEVGTLTGFTYLLDLENAPSLSSSTYGLRWAGEYRYSDATKANWTASYARQRDYADNPNDYSTDYYLLEAGAKFGKFGVKAGYEVLGGDTVPNHPFQTPLATLHVFEGWADKFLTTPSAGIEDFYLGVSANLGALTLQLVWHDFRAEAASIDYGTEWNASAAYKFGAKGNYEVLLKFADYQAADFATDTTKAWVQVSAAF